jgi:hypothetical protein
MRDESTRIVHRWRRDRQYHLGVRTEAHVERRTSAIEAGLF